MIGELANEVYEFGKFRLDAARRILQKNDGSTANLTPKAFDVLLALIEGDGKLLTKDELMEHVWSDSFVEEANLTQTISVLRRALGEHPGDHRFIVTEPGRGYRFVAKIKKVGETTSPDTEEDSSGIEPEIESDAVLNFDKTVENTNSRPIAPLDKLSPPHGRTLFFGAAAAVFIGLLAAVYLFFPTKPETAPNNPHELKSIAVLPFKTIGADEENKYVGLGMTETLIVKLSKIKRIIVRQTSAVLPYADMSADPTKIGNDLEVDALLDGSVQKDGNRVRVSARLVRVSDGAPLWAETFSDQYMNLFDMQDSISEKVAQALMLELTGEEQTAVKRRYTDNIEAYQLYNKGRFFWNNRSGEDLRKSIVFYEQAIAKDANYALAYAGLAETYVVLHMFSQGQEIDAFPKARLAAERALSKDENLAEAHTALALYKEQYAWDWEGTELEFKRAISVNPNYATAHQWYGEFLAFMGRTEESISEVEKAVAFDPLSLSTNTARAFPYLAARQYDQAIEKLKPALELEEDFPLALYYLGRSYDGSARYNEAVVEYQKAIAGSGRSTFFISALIYSLAKSGQKAEAEKAFAEISETSKKRPVSRYVLARSLAALGNKEKALDELEKAFQERDSLMIVMTIDQNFDEIRDEIRFQEILRKMNLSQ